MKRILTVVAAVALASSCAHRKIPGTEIDDTDDTRAILAVMETYRQAVEKRDAHTLVSLAHDTFRDDGGSANPEDDLNYSDLTTKLPERLAKLEDIRLEVSVRKIEFDEEAQVAHATYTYTATFKLPNLTQKAQSEGEIKQMSFKKVDKHNWKITSGI
ncbi:MAG: DUF4440 domain-containing protein [Myxococcaceae bacterium]|nr:DUF4440 domain-containing protein [Myxococcaceae bacterium]